MFVHSEGAAKPSGASLNNPSFPDPSSTVSCTMSKRARDSRVSVAGKASARIHCHSPPEMKITVMNELLSAAIVPSSVFIAVIIV